MNALALVELAVPAAAMLLALMVDHWLGEPPVRWHPVVAMGAVLSRLGQWAAPVLHPGPPARCLPWCKGTLGWCVGALLVVGLALGLDYSLTFVPLWLQVVLMGVLLKPLLAWRMLHQEVQAVESALALSLAAGREQLARLVSRDVAELDEAEVREAALSTLAENLNDSVVAPLFWFALAGLPGAALYRWANTADAMWGYRGERQGRIWTWAGHWAARADDVLSWVPARLTAVLLMWAATGPKRWGQLRQLARLTPSPNGGWPMGALALALNVRLGKAGVYVLHAGATSPLPQHMAQSQRLCQRALCGATLLLGGLAWAVSAGLLWWQGGA